MFNKFFVKNSDYLYVVFRFMVGLLFAQHGAQKLFGLFDGTSQTLFSLMGLAGAIEFFGGLFIAFGLFTRLAALLSGLEMIAAYGMAHASQGLIPIVNKGELALLYLACFLVIVGFGARRCSVERLLFKKETF